MMWLAGAEHCFEDEGRQGQAPAGIVELAPAAFVGMVVNGQEKQAPAIVFIYARRRLRKNTNPSRPPPSRMADEGSGTLLLGGWVLI